MSDFDPEFNELREELDNGKRIAKELVDHVLAMGAGGATIPIHINDEKYVVTVTHVPVQEEP